ncbi:MAG: hypothetical protein ACRD2W_21225 [Acidimicrobiales bacterium]
MSRATRPAEFRCRTCDGVAVVVSSQDGGVATSGFLGTTWLRLERGTTAIRPADVDRAIAAADAVALHGLHPEFQPAWCPGCGASYCRAHWQLDVAGADDHPGWYEATYGTCPDGHRRKLDD